MRNREFIRQKGKKRREQKSFTPPPQIPPSLRYAHLNPNEVLWFKIVGRAAAPVNYVFVLTFAPQLTIPVGDTQVIVHQAVTHMTVSKHRVEEGLQRKHMSKYNIFPGLRKKTKSGIA